MFVGFFTNEIFHWVPNTCINHELFFFKKIVFNYYGFIYFTFSANTPIHTVYKLKGDIIELKEMHGICPNSQSHLVCQPFIWKGPCLITLKCVSFCLLATESLSRQLEEGKKLAHTKIGKMESFIISFHFSISSKCAMFDFPLS